MVNSRHPVSDVLHADSPPDVGALCSKAQCPTQHVSETLRSLCEDLVRVPVRGHHHCRDANDVVVWDIGVEEIAHRIHEYHAGLRPCEGLYQFLRYQAQVEAPLVWMAFDSPETLSKRFGVTVLAPGTDLCASSDGIPCRVSPFDLCLGRHASPRSTR